MYDYIT